MRGLWLLAVALTLGAVTAGLVATLVVSGDRSEAIAEGEVFSTEAGDPLDVFYGAGDRGLMCMNVGAFYYGSAVSCVDPATVDETGSWMLEIPEVERKSPVVVGILPADGGRASVQVGSTRVEASTRGRWFVASLPVGTLGSNNDAPVEVVYSS